MEVTKQRQGHSITSKIYWTATTDHKLDADEAQTIQMNNGYHPNGYGFFNLKAEQCPNGKWKNVWSCWASCD